MYMIIKLMKKNDESGKNGENQGKCPDISKDQADVKIVIFWPIKHLLVLPGVCFCKTFATEAVTWLLHVLLHLNGY